MSHYILYAHDNARVIMVTEDKREALEEVCCDGSFSNGIIETCDCDQPNSHLDVDDENS